MRAPNVLAAAQTLSGGNQQRIVLAKWLATDPKVLLLDSPTVGVDIGNKQGIYQIIQGLAETGVAILLISDEIAEVYFNCDRVLHMRAGRIVDDFIPGVISENTLSEAVYA
jgi:simple sugar transport system ATP-binding protein